MRQDNITNILKTEGIMSQGFGISPKILFRDKRLTPEAKAIYGYLASYAGSGKTAFPGRDLMLEELGMSVKRYYKHLNLLIQYGYLKIEKSRDRYGSFDKNTYVLVSNPVPVPVEKEEPGAVVEKKKPRTAGKKETADRDVQWVRRNMAIDALEEQQPDDKSLLEKIYLAAKDMEEAETIKVGGAIKNKQSIQAVLENLNADTTRVILHNYKKALHTKGYTIYNTKSFLQALICNSLYEVDTFMESFRADQAKQETIREEKRKKEKEQEERMLREEMYNRHPKLLELQNERNKTMMALSKVILSGNEIEKERLLKKKADLEENMQLYLEKYNLPDIV